MTQILITGSRKYYDYEYFVMFMHKFLWLTFKNSNEKFRFIFGDSSGADSLSLRYCEKSKIEYKIYKANWQSFGLSAGPIRNQQMVDDCKETDICIGFPDKESKGTIDCMNRARSKRMEVIHAFNFIL